MIFASSLGTVFEWYDFYLYGSLAIYIGANFFSQYPETTRNIFALLAFAAGFLVRPFGATVFGRLGDIVGRKYTFLITILIMGVSTFLVGVLPGASQIGIAAPIILIILRMLQGLALGGEYGGAATYVAEHAPNGRRGYYTSWIQTTATLGLFLSLMVILGVQFALGKGSLRRTGLAYSLPRFGSAAWRIGLDSSENEQISCLQEDEGRRQDLQGTAQRSLRPVEKRKDRPACPRRRRHRSGRRLVYGPVLCTVLPAEHSEGGRPVGQHHGRGGPHPRHGLLRALRLAFRQDRPQADHHGGSRSRDADLLPAVQRRSHGRATRHWRKRRPAFAPP